MLSRVGGAAVALGLIAAPPSGLAQEAIKPPLENQPIPESRQQTGADQSQQRPAQEEAQTDRIAPVLNAIEAAIRDLIAKEDAQQRERQEHREIADLQAQQDIAFWAKAMFWATFATVWLTFIGIVLIGWTLYHTRRAADAAASTAEEARKSTVAAEQAAAAAVKSNEISRDAMITTHRAWLLIEEARVVEPLQWTGRKGKIGVEIRFRNSGQTPALWAWASAEVFVGPSIQAMPEYRKIATREKQYDWRFGNTVLPGQFISYRITIIMDEAEVNRWFAEHQPALENIVLTLIGCMQYNILFDDKRHQTGFIREIVSQDEEGSLSIVVPAVGDTPADRLRLQRGRFGDIFVD